MARSHLEQCNSMLPSSLRPRLFPSLCSDLHSQELGNSQRHAIGGPCGAPSSPLPPALLQTPSRERQSCLHRGEKQA